MDNTQEYSKAYKEVLSIFEYLPEKDLNKIPESKMMLFVSKADKNYQFNYDPNKTLNENKVSKKAKAIIAILYRDYWASTEKKNKIKNKQINDRNKVDKIKVEKYNLDNIFDKNIKPKEVTNDKVQLIEIKKMTWYNRFFSKIKYFFKKK